MGQLHGLFTCRTLDALHNKVQGGLARYKPEGKVVVCQRRFLASSQLDIVLAQIQLLH